MSISLCVKNSVFFPKWYIISKILIYFLYKLPNSSKIYVKGHLKCMKFKPNEKTLTKLQELCLKMCQ